MGIQIEAFQIANYSISKNFVLNFNLKPILAPLRKYFMCYQTTVIYMFLITV